MATRPPAPDYTGRDYASALTRLQRLVQSIFPKWTDFNKANFGNMLLRCLAFIVDIISKYTDFMATESLPEHAKLRRSVQAHSRWIGYELDGRVAATVTLKFTLPNGAHSADITIFAGTIIRVSDVVSPTQFQLLANVTITAGQTQATGLAEHSENAEDTEASTGGPDQVFRLSQAPYIQGSMEITANDGVYTQVANFLASTSTDKHFVITIDDEEKPVVRFGNGVNGKIPVGDILFEYKVGGGFEGNVDADTITDMLDTITDVFASPVQVAVTNEAAASGGVDPETLEHAKQQAPAELRVLNRTIAREDYEIGARSVPGVATALFLTSEQTVLIREAEGVGWILALGTQLSNGSFKIAVPSAALLASVEEYWRVTKPKPTGVFVRAVGDSANIKSINVVANVFLNEKADKTVPAPGQPTNIGLAIFTALDEFFAVVAEDGSLAGNVDWGFNLKDADGIPIPELAWSTIFDLIQQISGVRKIRCEDLLLNGVDGDVALRLWEFPQLGTVQIIDAATGAQLYPAV